MKGSAASVDELLEVWLGRGTERGAVHVGCPLFLILIGLSECHSGYMRFWSTKGEEAPKRADVVGWSSSQTCIFVSGFFKSASFVRTIHFSPVTKSNCKCERLRCKSQIVQTVTSGRLLLC